LGQAPGPDFPDVEELRVPIFMTPGNHDYRKHPYHLIFDLIGLHRIPNFANYRLEEGEAIALWQKLLGIQGVPKLGIDDAARMVEIDPAARPFRACLADGGSYVVRLGVHRLVMLDSAHDVGVLTSFTRPGPGDHRNHLDRRRTDLRRRIPQQRGRGGLGTGVGH